MFAITASVGEGGVNWEFDVEQIQQLLNLNLHFLKGLNPLIEDGLAGNNTIEAIKLYQRNVLKLDNPAGLVDANRTSIKWLNKTARQPRLSYVTNFILKTLPVAKNIKLKYKIPVSVLIAQAALDLDWGKHIRTNQYFGFVPRKAKQGKKVGFKLEYINGKKVVKAGIFRSCDNFHAAAEGYGYFLSSNPQFKSAFQYTQKPLIFAEKIQRAGFSPDPFYANKIRSLITKYALSEYD